MFRKKINACSMPMQHDTPIRVHDRLFVPLISEAEIQARVAELAVRINEDYAGRNPLIIVVLNGAFVFAADLVRLLTIRPEIQFIRISTYGNSMQSTETARVLLDLEGQLEHRHVVLIEDIVDTGYTMDFFLSLLDQHNPASVRVMTLLFKPERYGGRRPPEYIGFRIPPAFVVGYGMDYAQQGRELRAIYQPAPEPSN